jgi:hypothetical protein
MRKARNFLLLVCALGVLSGQSGLSYTQLRQFIKSSVEQKLRDKDVANYLKRQVVQFAITDRLVEEFVGWGVGPRTLKALEAMQVSTADLPEPKPVAVTEAKQRPRQPPPPNPAEQKRIIEEARRQATAYTDELPNYVCLQLTRRFFDPTGLEMDWLKHDEIKTRVSYYDGREAYEPLTVNDLATTKGFSDLGGTTTTGEFGTILDSLFAAETDARFRWARHSLLRGNPVYVFHLEVPQYRSSWSLTSSGGGSRESVRTIRAGYTGLVYVDKNSGQVLRIVMEAQGIPTGFPMQEARSRLDYDFIDLSGESFLLPLKAQIFVRSGRLLTRNDLEFRLYRKFTAEATITFEEIEDLEPLPEDHPED